MGRVQAVQASRARCRDPALQGVFLSTPGPHATNGRRRLRQARRRPLTVKNRTPRKLLAEVTEACTSGAPLAPVCSPFFSCRNSVPTMKARMIVWTLQGGRGRRKGARGQAVSRVAQLAAQP